MNLRKTIEELDRKYHDRKVVLIDDYDSVLGEVGLIEAHRGLGLRHRALSLQLYRKINGNFELLLQKRAVEKPVFPFLWANTCCYNLAPGENYLDSAVSRINEEMGIDVKMGVLKEIYKFAYYAPDIEGWCENELDTVIIGEWDGSVTINPLEAMDYKWIGWEELNLDIEKNPDVYAPWFKLIVSDPRFRVNFE